MLAKRNDGSGAILEVADDVREKARKDIHAGKLKFVDWVKSQGGIVDTGMSDLISLTSYLAAIGQIERT